METEKGALIRAFHEDHAILGSGFFEISQHLRAGDIQAARIVAERVDATAGAHIAFEENCFYPALAKLSDYNVKPLYAEHERGRDVIARLHALEPGQVVTDEARLELLSQCEAMVTHIAECGELFKAMGRLPAAEQHDLYEALVEWRRKRPAWLELDTGGT